MSSIQLENINEIRYLRNVLERVSSYGIDVGSYLNKLNMIIDDYEDNKKVKLDVDDDDINLVFGNNSLEIDLSVKLEMFSVKIDWCILVLSLIDSTDSWSLDINIDKVFSLVYNKIDNIFEYVYDVDIQEKIVTRYYDLILKKILKDYENKVYEYLNEYNDIDKYVYLMDSVKRYLESKNIVLEDRISSYSLEDIINIVYNGNRNNKVESLESMDDSTKKDIVVVDKDETDGRVDNNSFFDNARNFLMNKVYYMMSIFKLDNVDVNNKVDMGVLILNDILNIDKEFIKKFIEDNQRDFNDISYVFNIKNFYWINIGNNFDILLEDLVDKEDKCKILNFIGKLLLTETFILRKTDAIEIHDSIKNRVIDFSWMGNVSTLVKLYEEIYEFVNRHGLMSGVMVNIISNKDFSRECLSDMSDNLWTTYLGDVDFTGANIKYCSLSKTGARIDISKVYQKSIYECHLEGCYVINKFKECYPSIEEIAKYDRGYIFYRETSLRGAILVDSFDEIEELERKLANGIDERFILDWDLVSYDYESNSFVRKDKKIMKLEKK